MNKIETFTQKYYNSVLLETVQNIKEKISQNEEYIIATIKENLKQYLIELSDIQRTQILEPISFIHISFLLISLGESKARIRLDAYTENGIIGSYSLHSKDIYIEYLNEILNNAKLKFINYAREDMVSAFIHKSVIEQMVLRMAIAVNMYIFELYKYHYDEIFEDNELNSIFKSDNFYITYGEYYDWQKTIFAVRPTIDIFNRDDKESLKFRKFDGFIYDDKVFEKLVIKNSKFIKCKFKQTQIVKSIFIDCIFVECDFTEVIFEDSRLLGATFDRCQIKHCNFKKTRFYQKQLKDGETFTLYKGLEMIDSSIDICMFDNCDLTNARLHGCSLGECNFLDTELSLSDFEQNIKEDI